MFDLNQLLACHQSALFKAKTARMPIDRQASTELAAFYAERIRRFRDDLDLPIYKWA